MTEISLIEVYRIVDSFFKYFEGNFLVAQISSFEKLRCAFSYVPFAALTTEFSMKTRQPQSTFALETARCRNLACA